MYIDWASDVIRQRIPLYRKAIDMYFGGVWYKTTGLSAMLTDRIRSGLGLPKCMPRQDLENGA
jgi:hypothetical protein